MSEHISLLGLQLGEVIVINFIGVVWRMRTSERSGYSQLEAATGLKINEPADVYALAKFLGEVLQAAGQPFALRFTDALDERDERVPEAYHELDFLSDELDEKDEDKSEIQHIEWDQTTYYQAHFEVIAAPQK